MIRKIKLFFSTSQTAIKYLFKQNKQHADDKYLLLSVKLDESKLVTGPVVISTPIDPISSDA